MLKLKLSDGTRADISPKSASALNRRRGLAPVVIALET